jgi:hypothetical protein
MASADAAAALSPPDSRSTKGQEIFMHRTVPVLALWLAACATQPAAPVADTAAPAPVAVVSAPIPAQPVVAAPAPSSVAPAVPPAVKAGTLDGYLEGLKEVSCPAGVAFQKPETVTLSASPVPVSTLNPGKKTVGALTFVAGFHLTSSDKRFGGLSDIHFLPDGNLLTVSDLGHFVWLDLGKDGITPVAARIADMLDAQGKPLDGKREADSEGLAVNGGMALASFERDHRVLAYDLGDCGAAARGAPIVYGGYGRSMPDAFKAANIDVPANTSLEALAVTPDWFMFSGIEQQVDGSGPLSARPVEAPPVFDLRVEKGAPDFVAIDLVPENTRGAGKAGDVRAFTLHRGFSSLLGNAIVVSETHLERYLDRTGAPASQGNEIGERSRWRYRVTDSRRLAEMNVILTIDNFEGLAAKKLPDGTVRLFVISDDNYSSAQRTLLMVYDLPPEKPPPQKRRKS